MNSASLPEQHLVVVTEHFSPSSTATAQLIADLVDQLAREYSITVLTSTVSESTDSNSFYVVRFPSPVKSSTNVLSKTLAGLSFLYSATRWLLLFSRSNSKLLIVSNPPFIGAIGLFARLFKSSKYVYLLQDLFPRSAVLTGLLPARGPITYLWQLFMSLVLTASTRVIVLNSLMTRRCIQDFSLPDSKVISIDNWAVEHASLLPKSANPLARQWNTYNTFTVQYSGNFGRLHDILTILEASRLLCDKPIKFTFIGNGAKRCQISMYKELFNLDNVTLYPYQSRSNLTYSLGACDISIISMIPGSEDTVAPSKFYGIIASGKPVLLIGNPNSDIAQLILKHKCGIVSATGDPVGLTRSILDLQTNPEMLYAYGMNALKLYQQHYGILSSSKKYSQLFNSF